MARRLLLAWLVAVAVFLMHASASAAGCSDGTHADFSGEMPMAGAAAAAPAVAVAALDNPLSALAGAGSEGSGEVCLSLPAGPWLAGLLRLLPLAIGGAAAWMVSSHRPRPRRDRRWRAPPSPGSLLLHICVCRT